MTSSHHRNATAHTAQQQQGVGKLQWDGRAELVMSLLQSCTVYVSVLDCKKEYARYVPYVLSTGSCSSYCANSWGMRWASTIVVDCVSEPVPRRDLCPFVVAALREQKWIRLAGSEAFNLLRLYCTLEICAGELGPADRLYSWPHKFDRLVNIPVIPVHDSSISARVALQ